MCAKGPGTARNILAHNVPVSVHCCSVFTGFAGGKLMLLFFVDYPSLYFPSFASNILAHDVPLSVHCCLAFTALRKNMCSLFFPVLVHSPVLYFPLSDSNVVAHGVLFSLLCCSAFTVSCGKKSSAVPLFFFSPFLFNPLPFNFFW